MCLTMVQYEGEGRAGVGVQILGGDRWNSGGSVARYWERKGAKHNPKKLPKMLN